ncbi:MULTISPECIES: DUF262 domain-containing protein [unclassified Synechocystis]|uniref:DUF262 domain-containing protein n=1 Tax=unclassified Synechocystis TaxID=2640012 RepID=UPI00056EFA43|nr:MULTISPECIES: DUF262 domain-containing protein [unclassified Synechocystis]MCT0253316.1 DUF262 domain-containing protein [Synechocystis sp. CS-94]
MSYYGSSLISSEEEILQEVENEYEETFENDDFFQLPPDDVIAFNELRSCADIYRLFTKKQLKIEPEFQRQIIWPDSAKTRFIDSLMKQLPIPSMCISLDYKTDQRLVVDGLQRIFTIVQFLGQGQNILDSKFENWRLSSLADIDQRIKGKTVNEIKNENPLLFERVENLTLPITVIRFDSSKESHMNYLYTIFHRLNTGGTKLSNQEIRNCIYQGLLNNLLKECVNYQNWMKLKLFKEKNIKRLEDQEFILRFFAFLDDRDSYGGTLSRFLNNYMENHRNLTSDLYSDKYKTFQRAVDILCKILEQDKPFDISKVVIEGLLIGIAVNLPLLEKLEINKLRSAYEKLRQSEVYLAKNLQGGLLKTNKVKERFEKSIQIFGGLSVN